MLGDGPSCLSCISMSIAERPAGRGPHLLPAQHVHRNKGGAFLVQQHLDVHC